jgi:D-tyrosyl-tRNA(Tyr) deacylase
MRAVIQRVSRASVSIDEEVCGAIASGLLILLGICVDDAETDADWLAAKIANMRIFSDEQVHMNLSVIDNRGELLVVSQFTLHAKTKKGNRPSFIDAARPEQAIPLYEYFIRKLEEETKSEVKTGKFGAMMQVSLVNDGPVTIVIDSGNRPIA